MCTLSYIPAGPSGHPIVTVNRDESPERNAMVLQRRRSKNGTEIWYPAEPVFGGSNVVVQSSGRVCCLLNGAFLPHPYRPPYAKSRGILLLDYIEQDLKPVFMDVQRLQNIEPFLLVDITQHSIDEFRWDGTSVYHRKFASGQPHLWASAQMYSLGNRMKRKEMFWSTLQRNNKPASEDLTRLHAASFQEKQGFLMEFNGVVQTVSITNIVLNDSPQIIHHNLISGAVERLNLG